MRDTLTIWWERNCNQDRQKLIKPYPLPWDGASHAIMANFFAIVGYGDERHTTKERLGTVMYLARPFVVEKILEIWKAKKDAKNTNPK